MNVLLGRNLTVNSFEITITFRHLNNLPHPFGLTLLLFKVSTQRGIVRTYNVLINN